MTAPFTAVSLSNAIVPELWAQWEMRSAEIARPVDPRTRVGAVRSRGPEYRYIAGAEVASLRVVPDGMAGIELPAKAYAVYRHDGAYRREDRDGTYFRALEKLRSNGMEHDPDAWGLEIFRSAGDGPPDGTECEIYIPLK
nr:GyrI-like domain-containing protein [Cohnella xylanilytica]